MAQISTIPDVLSAFDDALAASERLRDTFARMGETELRDIAQRNVESVARARATFLSVFEPREVRRPDSVHPAHEELEP